VIRCWTVRTDVELLLTTRLSTYFRDERPSDSDSGIRPDWPAS